MEKRFVGTCSEREKNLQLAHRVGYMRNSVRPPTGAFSGSLGQGVCT